MKKYCDIYNIKLIKIYIIYQTIIQLFLCIFFIRVSKKQNHYQINYINNS